MRRRKHRVTITEALEIRCSCGWEANHPFEGTPADAELLGDWHVERAAIDEAEAKRIARENSV